MKFKKAIAVIATTAALMLAAPTAANAAETKTYTNTASSCRLLVVTWVNAGGGGPFNSTYAVNSGQSKTFSTAGHILSHKWTPGCF
ncbi:MULTISPECIES: hypothetical protein [Oerskovia]|uniref:Secreted protein n=2 Tax=Oerskovia TaxID=162491 RepID=A0ABR8V165_9CELL|nr:MULTISPECIES: hypothetical protein [Oerskovia]MBD7998529.1 hypothetical protein [Oerskovia gallyi]MBM7498964.1 hypothetical protein [Oerskovia paurometabola]